MDDISEWYVPTTEAITMQGSSLLIPVEPGYRNRKKAGTMRISLSSESIKRLRRLLDEHQDRDRLIEIAEAELKSFEQEQRNELQAKKKELRNKLGLEGDPDLPWTLT